MIQVAVLRPAESRPVPKQGCPSGQGLDGQLNLSALIRSVDPYTVLFPGTVPKPSEFTA